MSDKLVMKKAKPPPVRERHDWTEIARQLKRQPGEWFKVVEGCKASTIAAIRQGGMSALRDNVEVQQRNTVTDDNGVRRADLYLRWTGDA